MEGRFPVTVRSESRGAHHDGTPRGRRIIVPLGGVDHALTEAEATELRDSITRALGAPPALTDREAMVFAVAFDRVLDEKIAAGSAAAQHPAVAAAIHACGRVRWLRLAAAEADSGGLRDFDDTERAMVAAMTGGGR